MASIANAASYQDISAINRHSLHTSMYMPQHAAPFEGIVDFTASHQPTSHAQFGPYAGSSDLAFQHQASALHRADATEWKQPSFFSYRPNEVKHRKRTTRQQLKILEETFRTTQKPDGNVRKALASQLDMTPRNVQVWFQNRRAKDKTLAKRAQKVAEEGQGHDSSLDAPSPSVLLHETEQYNNEVTFQGHQFGSNHSGSTSPVEATSQKPFEVPTPVNLSKDISQPQPFHPITSISFSSLESDDGSSRVMSSGFHPHGAYAVDARSNPLNFSRALFAPRNSLPHIHATPYQQDNQHQRSNSSPAFLNNVDTSSNLSLTTYASINGVLYPQRLASSLSQQPAQSVYNSSYSASVHRAPSGPLPSSDFTFGTARANMDADRDSDVASFAHYQLGSASGTDTPSSLSGLSQYGSVASLVDGDYASLAAQGFEDDSSLPSSWQHEQRRGSASSGVRQFPASRIGRDFSPLSVGYSSCSPRAGATPSSDPESDGSDPIAYLTNRSNWLPTYAEESKPNVQQLISAVDVKPVVGYQQEAYGFNGYSEQDGSHMVDAAFQSTFMPLMETGSYGSQTSTQYSGGALDASYGSDNRIPLGGFRPVATAGYQFA